jgi:hypothetical protein
VDETYLLITENKRPPRLLEGGLHPLQLLLFGTFFDLAGQTDISQQYYTKCAESAHPLSSSALNCLGLICKKQGKTVHMTRHFILASLDGNTNAKTNLNPQSSKLYKANF